MNCLFRTENYECVSVNICREIRFFCFYSAEVAKIKEKLKAFFIKGIDACSASVMVSHLWNYFNTFCIEIKKSFGMSVFKHMTCVCDISCHNYCVRCIVCGNTRKAFSQNVCSVSVTVTVCVKVCC